jgi:hypothetical protein
MICKDNMEKKKVRRKEKLKKDNVASALLTRKPH